MRRDEEDMWDSLVLEEVMIVKFPLHCVKKHLKKGQLEFASPSGDYHTFLCLTLSFLIVNPLILLVLYDIG